MRKKKIRFWIILPVLLLAMTCIFTGCPADTEGDGNGTDTPGENPNSKWPDPVPQDPINPAVPSTKRDKKVDGSEQQIVHEVWMGIDTNTDPRCPAGYKLANSKKQFFDNVVIFHSDIAWDHYDPDRWPDIPDTQKAWCPKTGMHHHLNDEIQWLLANYDTYIKPLKEAGLRVLVCPLPGGQGVTYGTIGSWPGNGGNAAWESTMGYPYPFDDAAARLWAKELADFCAEYGFDGIALDEEYGAVKEGSGSGLKEQVYNGTSSIAGANIFRWLRYFKDYTTDADHPNGKWVSVYVHRYCSSIPGSLEVNGVTYQSKDVIDAAFPSNYGSTMTSANGLPRSNLGMLSIAFDAFASVTTSPDQIKSQMNTLKRGGFGVVMYFALRERKFYNSLPYFGSTGTQPEDYLTRIAEVLYKDGVIYEGPDYNKFPEERAGSTNGTGALDGH